MYLVLGAGEFNLPALALGAQAGDVSWEVEDGGLVGEGGRGIGRWAGHVQSANVMGAAGEVAQGDELGGSRGGHDRWKRRRIGSLRWDRAARVSDEGGKREGRH